MLSLLRVKNLITHAALITGLVLAVTGGAMSATKPDQQKLLKAAAAGEVAVIEQLLKSGVPVDSRNAQKQTALLIATHHNRPEAARVLIAAGADVNAKDAILDSPYLYAGARGHLEILKMTLAHGADLQSTNRYGGTALIPAAERGHVETVRTLLEAGIDADHINNLGWTALMEAVILGDGGEKHIAIVEILKKAGADLTIPDSKGVSALQHAKNRGYSEIVAILEN